MDMNSSGAERQELERVVELLGKTTRPSRFLAFIGDRYFQRHDEPLTEFTIAAEVFGRSPKNFDSTQDAVVRVEAHRLRKKLREIYDKSQSPHGLQISLPAGTYVIKFLPSSEVPTAEPVTEHSVAIPDPATDATPAATPEVVATRRVPRLALYLGAIVVVIFVVAARFLMMHGEEANRTGSATSRSTPTVIPTRPEKGTVTEVHLLAGYSGSEVIDNSGVRWTPDRFFNDGAAWPRTGAYVRATSRQFMFANSRSGQFAYDIPLERGTYELRLFFVSPHRVGDERLATFNVMLNGKTLLSAFDVNISANGADVADERVFRDISPGADGYLRLGFSNGAGTPSLNALEISPGEPGKQKEIRISTQSTSFVDHQGRRWRADDYYLNGMHSTDRAKVSGTADPELFAGERYGHFSYAIPVDPRGSYTVILHFAEFYFGPQLEGGGGTGSRVFHVYCNGQALLQDFDIFKEAGSLRVVTKRFPNIRPSAQGKINLTFEPVINNATVSGIEVIDESH